MSHSQTFSRTGQTLAGQWRNSNLSSCTPVCCRARQQPTRVTECSAIADDRQTFLHGLGVCFRLANRNHASGFFNQAFETCDLYVKVSQRVRLPVVNQDNQPQRVERRDRPHKVKASGEGCHKDATFRRCPATFTMSSPTVVKSLATDASVLRTSVDGGGI